MTTLAIPPTIPHMGGSARRGGVVVLAAVLAAGAVVGTVAAERATVGHVVPGLGQYGGGRYCITQTPPFEETTTPDTVSVWTSTGQSGPYNTHDATDVANMRSVLSMPSVTSIEECWEGK